ncbi:hypothetical protein LIER_16874 [Lithospermum erythrorhizon]|uniref:Uncharacterized protein n=1 Tax=Lithospermum erythrorhizon TaxID=34254 RepID=A0AAV3QAQ1_LITER
MKLSQTDNNDTISQHWYQELGWLIVVGARVKSRPDLFIGEEAASPDLERTRHLLQQNLSLRFGEEARRNLTGEQITTGRRSPEFGEKLLTGESLELKPPLPDLLLQDHWSFRFDRIYRGGCRMC